LTTITEARVLTSAQFQKTAPIPKEPKLFCSSQPSSHFQIKTCGSAGMLASTNPKRTLKFNANCLREKYKEKCRTKILPQALIKKMMG